MFTTKCSASKVGMDGESDVNQDKMMKVVEQRISDRRIWKLIRQWLVSGVLYGNVLKISKIGISQGLVMPPLLANIYLNTLDR